jgi:hypothetical protein
VVSIRRFLRLAIAPGEWWVNGLAYAVIAAPAIWRGIDQDWRGTALIVAGGIAVLLLVGGVRLQRRLDTEPDLSLSFDGSRTPAVGVPIADWPGGGTGDVWHLLATADGAVARQTVATLVDLEIGVGSGFRRHPNWTESYPLRWAGPDSSSETQLDPQDPKLIDLGFTVAGGNLFYIGAADAASGGQLLGVGAGEYRLRVALRAENAEHKAVVKWFELRYDGSSVEIAEVAEQS